jgi:hypothetical protein
MTRESDSYMVELEFMGYLPYGINPTNPQPNQYWISIDELGNIYSWYEDHWVYFDGSFSELSK